VTIAVEESGASYSCAVHETVLQGMFRYGRRPIPSGCLRGGCGVCRVQVLSGDVDFEGPMSTAHVTEADRSNGIMLACRIRPRSDLQLRLCGRPHPRSSA
jgi:ferredoxin